MSASRGWTTIAVLTVLWSVPASSFGQTGQAPMFEGARSQNARENADFSLSAGTAYDKDAVSGPDAAFAGQLGGRFFTVLTPTLTFTTRGNRWRFGASGQSNFRYFADANQLSTMNHSLGIGVSTNVSKRATLFLNESISYSPGYLYRLFVPLSNLSPGDVSSSTTDFSNESASASQSLYKVRGAFANGVGEINPPGTDYQASPQDIASYLYSTNVALVHTINDRSSVEVDSAFRVTDFTVPANLPEAGNTFRYLRAVDGGARYKYSLVRGLRVRLDYEYRYAEYLGGVRPAENHLYLGFETNLSELIRAGSRTSLTFSLGPTAAKGLLPNDRDRYVVTGHAAVNHRLSRAWRLSGGFYRGFEYVEGLPGPAFGNATAVAIGGVINRRTDLSASAAYSLGEVDSAAGRRAPFDTSTTNIQLRFALFRQLAAYVEHFTYSYYFDDSIILPLDTPHNLTRQGMRAGVTLWVPLLRRR